MVGDDDPFYLKFWVNRPPLEAKSPILNWYSLARSASAVTPSEKNSINTKSLIWSSLRAFQWAQDEHRTLPLSPPEGG